MSASSIFGVKTRWTAYRGEYHAYTLVGGIPKDPDTIKQWLKARLEIGEAELLALADETIKEMGWTAGNLGTEEMDQLVDIIAARDTKGNSFKKLRRWDDGSWHPLTDQEVQDGKGELIIEGRQVKAALKEAASNLYPGTKRWPGFPTTDEGKGETRKGLAGYMVDRLEVVERIIPIGRLVPDITGEQRIKHITGPQGKRSTINVVDVCEDVTFSFTVSVLDDFIVEQVWGEMWEYIELGGIGADRARGDGRGTLEKWEPVKPARARR